MKTAFFIQTWDIEGSLWTGPYESLAAAKQNLDNEATGHTHWLIIELPVEANGKFDS